MRVMKVATLKSGASIEYHTVEHRAPTPSNPSQPDTYFFFSDELGLKAMVEAKDIAELEEKHVF